MLDINLTRCWVGSLSTGASKQNIKSVVLSETWTQVLRRCSSSARSRCSKNVLRCYWRVGIETGMNWTNERVVITILYVTQSLVRSLTNQITNTTSRVCACKDLPATCAQLTKHLCPHRVVTANAKHLRKNKNSHMKAKALTNDWSRHQSPQIPSLTCWEGWTLGTCCYLVSQKSTTPSLW